MIKLGDLMLSSEEENRLDISTKLGHGKPDDCAPRICREDMILCIRIADVG